MKGRLYKSRKDKMILGVCGGLSRYFEVDVSILRILWAATALFYGTGVLLYLVAAFVLPYEEELYPSSSNGGETDEAGPKSLSKTSTEDQRRMVAGILIAAGVLLLLKNFRFTLALDLIWPIGLVAVGAYLILQGRKDGNEK